LVAFLANGCRSSRGCDRTTVGRAANGRTGLLPPATDAQLQSLRLRYNAAYTAYRSRVNALSEAAMEGKAHAAELLEHEAKALRELNEARANLLAAMADR
jgi:hypothetical protein